MCQRTDSEFERCACSRRECVWPGYEGHSQFSERFGRGSHLSRAGDFRSHGIFAARIETKSKAHKKAGFSAKLNTARREALISLLALSMIGTPGHKTSQEIILRKLL